MFISRSSVFSILITFNLIYFSGCSTIITEEATKLPPENLSTLELVVDLFEPNIRIKKIDGRNVPPNKWEAYKKVIVPAGEHVFEFSYFTMTVMRQSMSTDEITTTWSRYHKIKKINMRPGKTYLADGHLAGGSWEVEIWQKTEEIDVKSKAFTSKYDIAMKYSSSSDNISPPMQWTSGPKETRSYVIICDKNLPEITDDANSYWLIYNIPSGITHLDENIPKTESLSWGAFQGKNKHNGIGYSGPFVPPGNSGITFYFIVYALDVNLELSPGANKTEVLSAMDGHVLAKGHIHGYFWK